MSVVSDLLGEIGGVRWNYDSEGRAVGMNGSLIKDMGVGRDEKGCEGLYCGWLKFFVFI